VVFEESGVSREQLLRWVASLERASEHPLAKGDWCGAAEGREAIDSTGRWNSGADGREGAREGKVGGKPLVGRNREVF